VYESPFNKGPLKISRSEAAVAALFLLMLLLALAPAAGAADRYVSNTGADSNPGTLAQPFLTIARGTRELRPGDTLYIRAGTYNEYINNGIASGLSWTMPVTIKGYPGERPVLMPIGGSMPALRIDMAPSEVAYIIIEDLVLDALKVSDQDLPVVRIGANAHHIRIKHCEIRNSQNGHGILLSAGGATLSSDIAGGYNEIIGNDIQDNGFVASGTDNHGIYLYRLFRHRPSARLRLRDRRL
jgi:hypothetical protein